MLRSIRLAVLAALALLAGLAAPALAQSPCAGSNWHCSVALTTAAVPSYSDQTANPVSTTVYGGLRVSLANGAGADVSSSNPLPIGVQDALTFPCTASAAGAFACTGSGPASGIIDTTGYSQLVASNTGNAGGNSLRFDVSGDGVNFTQGVYFQKQPTGSVVQTDSAASNATYIIPAYARYVRPYVSTYVSGTTSLSVNLRNANATPLVQSNQGSASSSGAAGAWPIYIAPSTNAGATNSRVMATASTNATSVKATAGVVYGYSFSNAAASARYVRLFNLATAPTVGTSTPALTIVLAAGATVALNLDIGVAYATGISYDITGGSDLDSDTTATSAGDVTGALFYK